MNTGKPSPLLPAPPEPDLLADLELCIARQEDGLTGKSIASQEGWAFLAKDTSDFLRWQFGLKRWNQAQFDRANSILLERASAIGESSARYLFCLVPEKSVVYSEYLPGILKYLPSYLGRPATALHSMAANGTYYLLPQIQEFKKIAQVYFRGDSHPTWVGSFLLYRAIHEILSGVIEMTPALTFNELAFSNAAYGGDLYGQLPEAFHASLPELFSLAGTANACEHLVRVALREPLRTAARAPVAKEYEHLTATREALVWNNRNTSLPRCVIFRDSTSQYFLDYLAEHFSRTVAIWHGGHVIKEVLAREKPDVVLHVQAERFVFTLPQARPIVSLPPPEGT